jgi:hypothetical protein
MTYDASFIANREVREIPRGWRHPKDKKGRYVPLLPNGYCAANDLSEEDRNGVGEMPAITPAVRARGVEIMAYETTTEGTPISPAFPDTPEGRAALVRYCAEHATTFGDYRADVEAWAGILFSDQVVLVEGKDGSIHGT